MIYNLEIDGSETNNVADEYPNKVKSLLKKYDDWAKYVGIEND